MSIQRNSPTGLQGIVDGIANARALCQTAAKLFQDDPLKSEMPRLGTAISDIAESWSGSWIGYHACIYLRGFRKPQPGEYFDANWGLQSEYISRTRGDWQTYEHEVVVDEILRRAGVRDFAGVEEAGRQAREIFNDNKEALLPLFDALLHTKGDESLRAIRQEIADLSNGMTQDTMARGMMPTQVMSHDDVALGQMRSSIRVPPHIAIQALVLSSYSYSYKADELARLAGRAERYLLALHQVGGEMAIWADNSTIERNIFIGHGRSLLWEELRNFIQNR